MTLTLQTPNKQNTNRIMRHAPMAIAPAASKAGVLSGEALRTSVVADDAKYLLQNYGTRPPVVFTHGKVRCFGTPRVPFLYSLCQIFLSL